MADRLFRLNSGRSVSLSLAGDPLAPRLVFLCLPMGLAGAFDPDPTVTATWGVHLITVDGPGYASSSPLSDDELPGVEIRADDVAEYFTHAEKTAEEVTRTDFGSIGVIGWGAGGHVALSLAARHPQLVDRVALVGSPAPKRSPLRRADDAYLETRKPRPTVAETADELAGHPWQRIDALGIGDDDPALALPGLVSRLERSMSEAATQGTVGVAADLVAGRSDSWASELSAITADTTLFYGADDTFADERDGKWFAKRIAGAEVVTLPGAGHLAIASEWKRILAHVAPHGDA